jgi:hypothetical protein
MRTFTAWIAITSGTAAAGVWGCGSSEKTCEDKDECALAADASADSSLERATPPDATDKSAGDAKSGGTDGKMMDGSKSNAPDAAVDKTAPRPVAPLSTSRVTSQTPTLHWALPRGVKDATVDLCLDRACSEPIGTPAHVTGTSYVPTSALPVGIVYWRLHPSVSTAVTSVTWQFTVGARSATIDASWGTTLDANGDGHADLAVGAPGTPTSAGSVYVYLGGPSGLGTTAAKLSDPGNAAGDAFGQSVASAGDINGDGYADLVVGAPGAPSSTGSAYVYLGGSSGLSTTPIPLSNPSDVPGDSFGQSVAGAGDVNGDGYADLVVGAPGVSHLTGSVYVYLGGPSGLALIPTTLEDPGDAVGDSFGLSVATAGDVNGDGYADLAVGAPGVSGSVGNVDVYLGGPSGLGSPPTSLSDPGNAPRDSFGNSVASAGDFNGDGYGDLVVGAPGVSNSAGGAYIYYGAASGIGTLPTALDNPDDTPGDSFGVSVACAGDVNGDGYTDLVVGAYNVSSATGDVDVFLGGPPSPLGPLVATLDDPEPAAADRFGVSVAGAGDVKGNGYSDVVVGADGASSSAGSVYVYPGGMPDLGAAVTLASPGGAGGRFGASVFGASH